MRYGISLPNFGELADPNLVVELAVLAERSGWNGFFVWDHIVIADSMPVADPWVQLAAVAAATETIIIGPMVTPLPRRRPWVLARQATTLDQLSDGRLILGVGIGFPPEEEFGTFGEPTGERPRADMLDEGLDIVRGMWRGEPFGFEGEHFTVKRTTFAPTPAAGSIPIWVAGMWPNRRPLRRAARFDGAFPVKMDMSPWTIDEVAELAAVIADARGSLDGFELVVAGPFDPPSETLAGYRAAGATWFVAGPAPDSVVADIRDSIRTGPPPE